VNAATEAAHCKSEWGYGAQSWEFWSRLDDPLGFCTSTLLGGRAFLSREKLNWTKAVHLPTNRDEGRSWIGAVERENTLDDWNET